MGIYPKTNSKGLPTGKYLVEVTANGRRVRKTAESLQEARRTEEGLRYRGRHESRSAGFSEASRGTTGYLAAAGSYTVGNLARDALVVWSESRDRRQSEQRFLTVCDVLGYHTPLAAVRTAALDDVVATLRARSLGPKTIHRYLAAFSAALRWAVSRDYLAGMPIVPWPKVGPGKDVVVSPADELRMVEYLEKAGALDVALVWKVLMATGARVGEVLELDPGSIGRDSLTFRGTKNGDDRTVPAPADLCEKAYHMAQVGWPTYRRVSLAFHRARADLQLPYAITPHVLRHTVGTRLSDAGVSVPTIGALLGHRSPRTTMGYIHPQRDAMKAAVALLTTTKGEKRDDKD